LPARAPGRNEFVCALPDVTLIEARRRLDQLRAELLHSTEARSISFGLSELSGGESPTELIDRTGRDMRAARTR
jgi:GGDEF domain-containing protein